MFSKNFFAFKLFLFFLLVILLSMNVQDAMAQLQIAPVALYMDDGSRTGRIVIRNSSSGPVEVEIELLFGYPATDENGRVFLKLFDSVPDQEPSAAEWIRAYPRHLTLEGGERQTVRFAARPPANLPDGEYWLRPAIVALIPNVQVVSHEEQNITTRLNMRKRTILSLNYRKGSVQTGIGMKDLSSAYNDGVLQLFTELERKGNAAYLGHTEIRIRNSRGNVVRDNVKKIAVYYDQKRTFEIDIHTLPPGTYTAEVELTTRTRNDAGILQASPASATATFTIP